MTDFELFSEQRLLAMLGWGEARGEGPKGILAVMHVAMNRANKQNRALKDIILQPWQFGCFNARDPNREKLPLAEKIEPESWALCDGLAQLVIDGWTRDPTGNSMNYYSILEPVPYWARGETGWKEITQIGRHVFGIAR